MGWPSRLQLWRSGNALLTLQRPRRWTGAANAGRFQDRRRQGLGAISDWSAEFEDPIELPNGRKLLTLRDAATYITKLPKAEHITPEWQAAMKRLRQFEGRWPANRSQDGKQATTSRRFTGCVCDAIIPMGTEDDGYLEDMSDQDIAGLRARAEERRPHAGHSIKVADGEAGLSMAGEWIKLASTAEAR